MAMELKYLELPALGLPFALGTLYNANKSQIVPAISLWENEDTRANVDVRPMSTFNTYMTTADSLDSKMNSLGIKGNLKISALANIVDIKGSGEFLKDKKTSKKQARVVFEVKGTTKGLFLSMNHFSKEKVKRCSEFITMFGATHVVFGITYGYQFFMILEKMCESEEEKLKVEGEIELNVTGQGGGGGGHYETEQIQKLKELKVRIHANIQIPSNPISFDEAKELFRKIPHLVKDDGCPMTVHLLPLTSVCPSLPKVYSQIREPALKSVTAIFEDLSNLEVALSGIQTSDIATREKRIRQKAKELSARLEEYTIWLRTQLLDIMSDPMMEAKLQDVLKKHENSPFSTEFLRIYVSKLEKEVGFIDKLVRMLTDRISGDDTNREVRVGGRNKINVDILSDDEESPIPFDKCTVYMLEIPIITVDDDLLETMKEYDPDNNNGRTLHWAVLLQRPLEDEEFQMKILHWAKHFIQLALTKHAHPLAHLQKFKCVFKGCERDGEPKIKRYDGSTGEVILISLPKKSKIFRLTKISLAFTESITTQNS